MLSDDQKNIVRSIMNIADPQSVFDWGFTEKTEERNYYYIQYNEKQVGYLEFKDSTTLRIKAGRHFCTFYIANPSDFDVNTAALFVVRSILYDFAININDNITDAPTDWKISLITSAKSVLTWAIIICGILTGIYLFINR